MSGPAVRTREFTDPTCPWAFSRPTGMRLLCLHGLPWSSSGAPDARNASDRADARMLRRHGGSYGLRIEARPDGDSGDPPIATSARSATIGIVLQYASGGRDERRARYSPQVSSAARGPARLGLPRAIGPADGCRRAAGSHRHDHARGAYPGDEHVAQASAVTAGAPPVGRPPIDWPGSSSSSAASRSACATGSPGP